MFCFLLILILFCIYRNRYNVNVKYYSKLYMYMIIISKIGKLPPYDFYAIKLQVKYCALTKVFCCRWSNRFCFRLGLHNLCSSSLRKKFCIFSRSLFTKNISSVNNIQESKFFFTYFFLFS